MQLSRLENMENGWFIGDFSPSVLRSRAVEVAVKHYPKDSREARHHHQIATEITVIISGQAQMNHTLLNPGDIVQINPGESAEFRTLSEVVTVVVKMPSVLGDKYIEKQS